MREYDPTTGRYLQADPLGLIDGPSIYGYARQNPGRYVDPDGRNPIAIGIGVARIVGGLFGGTGARTAATAAIGGIAAGVPSVPTDNEGQRAQENAASEGGTCEPDEFCEEQWERDQAECGRKLGVCLAGFKRSASMQRQCKRNYGSCMELARQEYLECKGY